MNWKTLNYQWKWRSSQVALYTIGLFSKDFRVRMISRKKKNRERLNQERQKKRCNNTQGRTNVATNRSSSVYYNSATIKKYVEKIRKSGFFDAEWYLVNYPDVDTLGMDPAEHYLKYGAMRRRDPGPDFCTGFYLDTHPGRWQEITNPLLHFHGKGGGKMKPDRRTILWAAANVAARGDYARGVALAERYLPEDLAYTAHILRANAALACGREEDWLAHLNAYLAQFDVAPLVLEGEGALLDRFATAPLPPVTGGGPLVSVIMPAFNAEGTIRAAARSILNQTWRNLELLIVDDASEDGTWTVLQQLAAADDRVKIRRNKVNVGPYVSKNFALMEAQGEWITGHDADDWAHPQRLERHIHLAIDRRSRASVCYMIRMQPDGFFGNLAKIQSFSLDGVARKASISCLFARKILKEGLGSWDSVRFGADTEMIARAENVLGEEVVPFHDISMICLDHDNSLSNHQDHGIKKVGGLSPIRKAYRDNWKKWHNTKLAPGNAFMPFPLKNRPYSAPAEMVVPLDDVEANVAH